MPFKNKKQQQSISHPGLAAEKCDTHDWLVMTAVMRAAACGDMLQQVRDDEQLRHDGDFRPGGEASTPRERE